MQIRQAMQQAQAAGVARLDAQWLLQHLFGKDRAWLLAHDDEELSASLLPTWTQLLQRRAGGEPLAYVLGQREFCGLPLHVNPAVLIPRPETEGLVDWALQCLAAAQATRPAPQVVDLGTGSGAIALAVKRRWPSAQMWATDASPAALAVAARNQRELGLEVQLMSGHWWTAVADHRFDLALANPPYVAAHDPHLLALNHEPRMALTPGGDGLSDLQAIIEGASTHLFPQAWLLLEHGHDQHLAVQGLMRQHGFCDVQTRQDLAGMPRLTGGRRP
jgi:release factor glutamine methyltransferase